MPVAATLLKRLRKSYRNDAAALVRFQLCSILSIKARFRCCDLDKKRLFQGQAFEANSKLLRLG